MLSFASMRARAALVTLALATTTVAATAPAALAEGNTAPALTSISLSSATNLASGDTLKITYAVTDDGDGLSRLRVTYTDPEGRTLPWEFRDVPLAGEISYVIPDYLNSGPLTATSVALLDRQGNVKVYHPADGVGVESLDITVTGSHPDATLPTMSALNVRQATVRGGEEVFVDTTIDEEHLDYQRSYVDIFVPTWYGASLLARTTPDARGIFHAVVPASTPPGAGFVANAWLYDLAGNRTVYSSATATSPARVQFTPGGTEDNPLLQDATFRVGIDPALPELRSITGTPVTKAGDTETMTFTAVGDHPVESVKATYTKEGYPAAAPFTVTSAISTPGTATWTVPDVPAGTWHLSTVRLTDTAGDWTDWARDGTLTCSLACPTEHRLNLTDLWIAIATPPSGPTNVDPFAGNGSARITWTVPTYDNGAPVTGYSVTVSPGGKVYNLSAATRSVTIGGLANDVRHTFAVRAKNLAGSGAATTTAATPRGLSRFTGAYDVDGDYRNDIIGMTRSGSMYLYKGTGTGTVRSPGIKLTANTSGVRVLLDSRKVVRESGGEELYAVLYNGDVVRYTISTTARAYRSDFTAQGFDKYRLVVSPGDFNGDGYTDLMGITDAGDLYLVTKTVSSLLGRTVRIGGGWSGFSKVVGVGDITGDKRNDLLARKKDGTLWLYAGNGTGGFAYTKQLFTGWNGYTTFAAAGDFNKDGRADVLALTSTGSLYLYKGNGKGGFAARVLVSTGFSSFV